MEYLPGMSLGEIIERFGPMPPERVIHLLRQACDALAEAHGVGLVHRDIKPGNIFAAKRGGIYDVAKLLDFGLVKPLMEKEPIHLTAEGTITGSPLFMSPEQALRRNQPGRTRSDIYSLGAVGYYLLTGHPPFEGDAPLKVIFAHAHDAVVPPANLRPDIPADLNGVILRCLEKNPADRFQTAVELGEALAVSRSGRFVEPRAGHPMVARLRSRDDDRRSQLRVSGDCHRPKSSLGSCRRGSCTATATRCILKHPFGRPPAGRAQGRRSVVRQTACQNPLRRETIAFQSPVDSNSATGTGTGSNRLFPPLSEVHSRLYLTRISISRTSQEGKRGQVQFAGTARRVLRTNWTCPLFPRII